MDEDTPPHPHAHRPMRSFVLRAGRMGPGQQRALETLGPRFLLPYRAETLRAWYDACVAQKSRIVALFDERFFRLWTFYLAGATAAFESGGMVNFQLQYARNRRSLPLTRDYMAEREAEYRAALDRLAGCGEATGALPRTATG